MTPRYVQDVPRYRRRCVARDGETSLLCILSSTTQSVVVDVHGQLIGAWHSPACVIAIWRSTHDPFSSTTTTSTSSLRADSHPPTRQGRSSARREDRAAPRDFPRSIVPSYRVRVPPWSSSAQLQAYCLELQVLSAHMVFRRVDRGDFELDTSTSRPIRCVTISISPLVVTHRAVSFPFVCIIEYSHAISSCYHNEHKETALVHTTASRQSK